MSTLDDLQPNATVRAILPAALVTFVSVPWFGSEAIELTYKTPAGKLSNELLYRHDEPRLEVVEQGRPWSFDGNGALFRLVSEAQRIRLAHLFDPVLAEARFGEYGILSNDIMPTEAALVPMVSLIDKFQDDARFAGALYWFRHASRFARYSGASATSLDEDLRDIQTADSLPEAIEQLLRRFRHEDPNKAEDFLRDNGDSRFGRFILYLLVYRNKALDWDEHSHRIGFQGPALMADFRPRWHHIFPLKYVEGHADSGLVDALANIAVIGPSINIRISAKAPLDYVHRYQITQAKLSQQFVDPAFTAVPFAEYEPWNRGPRAEPHRWPRRLIPSCPN